MRRRIPSITAMLCFEAAAKTEGFARAAEEMNVTQSAISRQIQTLEAFVGQSLFIRSKQRVKLTAAGKTLLAELSPLLEELELTILKTRSHDSAEGSLNIGVYPTLGSRWFMPIIMGPEADKIRHVLNLVTYLKNSEIDPSLVDLAIAQGDEGWQGYRADKLMAETLVAVGAPDQFPIPVEDPHALLDHRILQHSTRPLSWQIWFRHQDLKLPRKIIGPIFSQFEMLIDATKAGHGIAIIPDILIKKELHQGSLVKVHPFEANTSSAYFLLTPETKIGVARIERMRTWFLENMRPCDPAVTG
ncbi:MULTISPECIES: LysR substrate-binding domain-containing protein [unclassified Ruegeria]|uniref:LysR substrate-binding domain-containing protein n=1 Tax=unclassified Ruegeria TaxID=2625375 RepID=UPI001492BE5A|nr:MULTISPECIES: LysR substrate-binding domain-containing protein [unclassified Ruegeria]NOD77654.1 LysR family transcriptional regulator [Ruegeria sp. HKCCD4332]NOD89861.1 LysR family transcriptional regulator [Ruegeria sp. HKCCD4318]NOE14693.1 LysR family transcriptional regulator [Ruegeria sp. HKCCD4318-2]NOG10953.1 LysR family transcriptional regulator [Ruegeria sp. HKCCD4315]